MNPHVETQKLENGLRLNVGGEVDVSSADVLRHALDEALSAKPSSIEIDLSGLSYIDSTGIGSLVAASKQAEDAGIAFKLLAPQGNVYRVFTLLGLDKELNIEGVPQE